MNTFHEIIAKILSDYRKLLRRYLPNDKRIAKLRQLGLERKWLKLSTESDLYYKSLEVIKDIETLISSQKDSPSWYSGIEEFRQHLTTVLNNYRVIDNKVIHKTQLASNAMLQAIQILTFSQFKLDNSFHLQIKQFSEIIASYGTQEQQRVFAKALHKHTENHPNFFTPLLDNFHDQLGNTPSVDRKSKEVEYC